jgi:hypothetical protein
MSFAEVLKRVRTDFVEMPGLELTTPQAARLWSVGVDDCRDASDTLVEAGFLRWTARRTVVWTGRRRTAFLDLQRPILHGFSLSPGASV